MDYKDCMEFANANRTAYMATVEGNQPRVRPMGLWFANERGFYFNTETPKALYKQLVKNPRVELCFHGAATGMKVLRVTGAVEFVQDAALGARLLSERKFLAGLGIDRPDHPLLAIFRLAKGEAYFWTMAENMKEAAIPRVKFDLK